MFVREPGETRIDVENTSILLLKKACHDKDINLFHVLYFLGGYDLISGREWI